jgi:hypothetical protein
VHELGIPFQNLNQANPLYTTRLLCWTWQSPRFHDGHCQVCYLRSLKKTCGHLIWKNNTTWGCCSSLQVDTSIYEYIYTTIVMTIVIGSHRGYNSTYGCLNPMVKSQMISYIGLSPKIHQAPRLREGFSAKRPRHKPFAQRSALRPGEKRRIWNFCWKWRSLKLG